MPGTVLGSGVLKEERRHRCPPGAYSLQVETDMHTNLQCDTVKCFHGGIYKVQWELGRGKNVCLGNEGQLHRGGGHSGTLLPALQSLGFFTATLRTQMHGAYPSLPNTHVYNTCDVLGLFSIPNSGSCAPPMQEILLLYPFTRCRA